MQSGMEPPFEVLSYVDAHINEHAKGAKKRNWSPHEYPRDRRVWVSRVMPVRDGQTAFGWEYRARFEDAGWFWRSWVKPLDELKADKNLKTDGLTATHDLVSLESTKDFEGMLTKDAASAFSPDRQMVRGVEIIHRERNRKMICADGHEGWLYNEQFEYADLFRASGYHKFTLLPDPETGSGKCPVEDAASAIITINNGEGLLYKMMQQTAPGKIGNAAKLEGKEAAKIQRREPGEITMLNFQGDVDDINRVLTDYAGARIPQENMASLFRSESSIGRDFGTGSTALGGGDATNTATAAFANADAAGNVIGGLWGKAHECWMADVFADMLQLVKEYYDDESILKLVGIDRMKEWAQVKPTLLKDVEIVEVDAGSSLAGRVDKQREDAVNFLTIITKSDIANVRPALEDVCKAFGKDPGRYLISREDEAARAARQPGPQPDVVGGPDQAQDLPSRPSEAQGDTPENQMRSQASVRSAEAAQR